MKMRCAVQPAQVTAGLVIAHDAIEPNNLLKSVVNGSRGTRRRSVIGNDLENRAHHKLLLVSVGQILRVCWPCADTRQHQAGRDSATPAHKPLRQGSLAKLRLLL